MNLKIAICDDEKKDISKLQKYISQYNIKTDNNIMVSTYNSASKLLLDYNNFSFDVVLLDIEMPNINGLDIARQLRDVDDDLFIVFTTSYPEYMHESFEIQPFQFLIKPISQMALFNLFNNIIKKINRNSKSIIIVDDENEKHFISLNSILFIASMKENKLHIKYQLPDKELISKGTLSEVERKLISRGFVSPARGFIVNIKQIQSMTSTDITLKNGQKIPISRRRSKELQHIYSQYIIDIL